VWTCSKIRPACSPNAPPTLSISSKREMNKFDHRTCQEWPSICEPLGGSRLSSIFMPTAVKLVDNGWLTLTSDNFQPFAWALLTRCTSTPLYLQHKPEKKNFRSRNKKTFFIYFCLQIYHVVGKGTWSSGASQSSLVRPSLCLFLVEILHWWFIASRTKTTWQYTWYLFFFSLHTRARRPTSQIRPVTITPNYAKSIN
jgi:hypothetical protein